MSAPRTTSLLSIKAASVKAGEVVVPVMTAVGEWAELSATPAMWGRIFAEVKAASARARKSGSKGPRSKPRCTGCDYHGCPDCVTAFRPPITKPGGGIL